MSRIEDTCCTSHTRREFCTRAAGAVSLLTLGAIVTGCGSSSMSPSSSTGVTALATIAASAAGGSIAITIDAASPLAAVGSAALVQTGAASYLVARTAQNAFIALTAVCTHQGCTVSEYQNQIYQCPCHGSRYSTSGAVVNGPATLPLRQFATQFSGNVLTIATA
jgi:cytochrome b6-f complex iron-sulfur subunit